MYGYSIIESCKTMQIVKNYLHSVMDSRRILKVKFTILPKDMEGSEEKE